MDVYSMNVKQGITIGARMPANLTCLKLQPANLTEAFISVKDLFLFEVQVEGF